MQDTTSDSVKSFYVYSNTQEFLFKGELQCKTTLCVVKEGPKIRFFIVLVFLSTLPLKEKSYFFEKVVLLARTSAAKRNKIARSFGGERRKFARSYRRKGIEYSCL